MIVIGEVLRMPGGHQPSGDGLDASTWVDAQHEPRGLGDERLESPLAELRHFLACGGAEAPVVGGAVHEVPPCAHR